jgi:hypothetical protein
MFDIALRLLNCLKHGFAHRQLYMIMSGHISDTVYHTLCACIDYVVGIGNQQTTEMNRCNQATGVVGCGMEQRTALRERAGFGM